MKTIIHKLIHAIVAPVRFLIALDRNQVALNEDDLDHLNHKKL